MPLNYTTDKPAATVPMLRGVDCVGINIRMPRQVAGQTNQSRTVTFYFESVDVAGNKVEGRPLHVNIDDADLTSDADYARVFAALKRVAYKLSARAGYPVGGTVS